MSDLMKFLEKQQHRRLLHNNDKADYLYILNGDVIYILCNELFFYSIKDSLLHYSALDLNWLNV